MSHARTSPVRMLASLPLVIALAVTMFAGFTISPMTPEANAVITASKGEHVVDWARTRKGSPYSYGADGPHRFDCSGLTRWVFARVGKSLPHSSSAQVSHTKRIGKDNRRRGDLVFFYSGGGVYHVAIYAGHGYVWQASRPGTPVKRVHIWTSQVFYGRVR